MYIVESDHCMPFFHFSSFHVDVHFFFVHSQLVVLPSFHIKLTCFGCSGLIFMSFYELSPFDHK